MTRRVIALFEQKAPAATRPWRWTETLDTMDGPRTRFLDGSWTTQDEALEHMNERTRDGQ